MLTEQRMKEIGKLYDKWYDEQSTQTPLWDPPPQGVIAQIIGVSPIEFQEWIDGLDRFGEKIRKIIQKSNR